MKEDFFKYLEKYSNDTEKVNRLIVSLFLHENGLEKCKNRLISSLQIQESDSDFKSFVSATKNFQVKTTEDLIEAFEYVVSPEDKIVTGAVYTPKVIRESIVNRVFDGLDYDSNLSVCDPACGCSGFLLSAADQIRKKTNKSYREIFSKYIYGLDIQEFSIERSKILLSLNAILEGEDEEVFEFNFFTGNALGFEWSNEVRNFDGFDVILGNPPYVCSRNIDEESLSLIQNWVVTKTGHPDLYIPFFEIGLSILKDKGRLGYITMNTFFKSVNGRALRVYFGNKSWKFEITDFGSLQVFNSKSTYTCICIIERKESKRILYTRLNQLVKLNLSRIRYQEIPYQMLDHYHGWNLQEIESIKKIESTGIPFGEKFRTRNGIATLKNDIYIFNPESEDEEYFYKKSNENLYPIEKTLCKEVINPNKLTRLDSIESLRKKIIFPYKFINNSPEIIEEEEFASKFPKAFSYLLEKRNELADRDKGRGADYPVWYSYGRTQSLDPYPNKLFFPHIAPTTPNFVINNEPFLLFVNGLAVIGEDEEELILLKKIMSSRLFWFYITKTSKPYGSGYYSLSRNYIKNFGIYDFSDTQKRELFEMENQSDIDEYLEDLYSIIISE